MRGTIFSVIPAKLVPDRDRGAGIQHSFSPVIPAFFTVIPMKMGIQRPVTLFWIPASAGTTDNRAYAVSVF